MHLQATVDFWKRPSWADERTAILDARTGESLTYVQLYELVERGVDELKSTQKKLVLLCARTDIDCLLCYLALLAAGHTVWLWPSDQLSACNLALLERYRPDAIVCEDPSELSIDQADYANEETLFGYRLLLRRVPLPPIHHETALLLPTSGSTGNPRLVRISYRNVASNAVQVVRALNVCAGERWLCSLPFHYIFGLSVVNSALAAGATLVLGEKTIMHQDFWHRCRQQNVTCLPAVPSQLSLMRQVGHDHVSIAPIRKIAVSGSPIEPALHGWLAEKLTMHGVEIHSMYGMTEAAGRIAVLPAAEFSAYPECVGYAVPGGTLRITSDGEIEYSGPNVMLGYANGRDCLEQGDALSGVLRTGDVGKLDTDGRLYITGRRSRICKLFGIRIDLNDVEALCSELGPTAAISDEKSIYLFHTSKASSEVTNCLQVVSARMHLPVVAFKARQIDALPKTASGKTHYAALNDLVRATLAPSQSKSASPKSLA